MKKILMIFCIALLFSVTACSESTTTTTATTKHTNSNKNEVEAFGLVKSKNVKSISVELPVSVKKLYVNEGQRVKKNDVLVDFNDKYSKGKEGKTLSNEIKNGVVCQLECNEGDKIAPDAKIFSIVDLDNLYIEANVAEEFIKDVKVGSTVSIVPYADKTKTYKGKVTAISGCAALKNGETTVPVSISIDESNTILLPNYNVEVSIKK
jgi:multidrug resistance efflux pump